MERTSIHESSAFHLGAEDSQPHLVGPSPPYEDLMADYRRWYVPGGSYFFTVVACRRAPLFSRELARSLLGDKLRECQKKWPFEVNAIVLLPDHLHTIWSLPPGDHAYPRRWAWTKKEFTKA